MLLNLNWIFI